MNLAIIVGNLGSDPETRTASGGTVITTMRVATSSRVKRGDEWKEETQWHSVVTFAKLAEACARSLSKGSKVSVQGEIRYRKWEKDGVTRTATEIVADKVEFLSPRKEDGGRREAYSSPDDDSIPF